MGDILIEKKLVTLFIDAGIDAIRANDDQNIHYMECSLCRNKIKYPVVVRERDIEDIKLLMEAMVSYIENDEVRKFALLNFTKELQELKNKYSKRGDEL